MCVWLIMGDDEHVCAVTPTTAHEVPANGTPQQQQETGKRKVREHEPVTEHIQVLLDSERDAYPCVLDYLADSLSSSSSIRRPSSSSSSSSSSEGGMNEAWRRKLCEWCYEVIDHFGFDREVVSIAMNYLDRSVALRFQNSSSSSSWKPVAKKDFQLLAVTSLYIAIKTHGMTENTDGPRRKLKIEAFVQLSRDEFSVETIECCERQILRDLKWRVNPPTNLRFIANFLKLLPVWSINGDYGSHTRAKSILYEVSRYLSELSVCVSKFSFNCPASLIAYASILCAMEVLQDSVQFPYDARVAFLKSIADAAGLIPEAPEVRRARAMLKDLCPSMFEGDELPSEFRFANSSSADISDGEEEEDSQSNGCGKASPVCVLEESYQATCEDYNSRRKRSRTCPEEPSSSP